MRHKIDATDVAKYIPLVTKLLYSSLASIKNFDWSKFENISLFILEALLLKQISEQTVTNNHLVTQHNQKFYHSQDFQTRGTDYPYLKDKMETILKEYGNYLRDKDSKDSPLVLVRKTMNYIIRQRDLSNQNCTLFLTEFYRLYNLIKNNHGLGLKLNIEKVLEKVVYLINKNIDCVFYHICKNYKSHQIMCDFLIQFMNEIIKEKKYTHRGEDVDLKKTISNYFYNKLGSIIKLTIHNIRLVYNYRHLKSTSDLTYYKSKIHYHGKEYPQDARLAKYLIEHIPTLIQKSVESMEDQFNDFKIQNALLYGNGNLSQGQYQTRQGRNRAAYQNKKKKILPLVDEYYTYKHFDDDENDENQAGLKKLPDTLTFHNAVEELKEFGYYTPVVDEYFKKPYQQDKIQEQNDFFFM
jgi:hypothetical protein